MPRRLNIGAAALGGITLVASAVTTLATARWARTTARAVARLGARRSRSGSSAAMPFTFSMEQVEGLPAPVRRYFGFALRPGQRMIAAARMTQEGDFAMRPGAWSPFTATHHVVIRPAGFVWDASIRMGALVSARVRDSYIRGVGRMHARAAAVIPMVNQGGTPEMASGSLHRYLAETPWVPTALLPSAGVTWTAIDDSTARASLTDHGITVSVDFRFNERGEITGMSAERLRDVNGKSVLTPWTGHFEGYESVEGVMIPRRGEVAWMLPDGPYPYWRGHIVDVAWTFIEQAAGADDEVNG